jgi:hypothetical protein
MRRIRHPRVAVVGGLLLSALWLASGQAPLDAQAPPASEASGDGALQRLRAVPVDALLAVVVDLRPASALLPELAGPLLAGESSPVARAFGAAVARRTGLTVAAEQVAFVAGPGEESWAVLAWGPVSGSVTLTPAREYRGHTLYVMAHPWGEPLAMAPLAGGLAFGSFATVTGVLEALAGSTPSFAAVEGLVGTLAEEPAAPPVVVVAGRTLLERANDEVKPGEPRWMLVTLSSTHSRVAFGYADEAGASVGEAALRDAMAEVGVSLAQLGVRADSAESWLVDLGLRFLHGAGAQALTRDVTLGRAGERAWIRFESPPPSLLLGIAAAVVVPAFERYVTRLRTVEASANLQALVYGATAYYNYGAGSEYVLGDPSRARFPDSAPLTPAVVPWGEARAPEAADWLHPTWQALGFAVWDSHYYAYQFDSAGTGLEATFTVSAFGDLDCDGVLSTFSRSGRVDPVHGTAYDLGLYRENELE